MNDVLYETAIPLHANLYVMGQSREREDIVAAEIAKDKKSPMFLISIRTEKQISSGLGIGFWVLMISGLLAVVGGVLIGDLVLNSIKGELAAVCNVYWRILVHHGIGMGLDGLQQPYQSAAAGKAGLVAGGYRTETQKRPHPQPGASRRGIRRTREWITGTGDKITSAVVSHSSRRGRAGLCRVSYRLYVS